MFSYKKKTSTPLGLTVTPSGVEGFRLSIKVNFLTK
jgi:hypothetical protein